MSERDEHDEPPVDLIGYEKRVQDAMRLHLVRKVLEEAMREPPPGAHHYYLTFRTQQCEIPADLLKFYPEEMTVVLQHQYWDLDVTDGGFSVTLKFSGVPRKMVVPWPALVRFYDPSVQFLCQWDPVTLIEPAAVEEIVEEEPAADGVVSLAAFRKPKR